MIWVSKLKLGSLIEFKENYYIIKEKTLHWTARGAWLITLKLKDITNWKILTETFRDKIKFTIIESNKKDTLYLYPTKTDLVFLDLKTSEMIYLKKWDFLDKIQFLKEWNNFTILDIDWKNIDVEIPLILEWQIEETVSPKDNLLFQSKKTAILKNGVRITWPSHMKKWDSIFYNTQTLDYNSKA